MAAEEDDRLTDLEATLIAIVGHLQHEGEVVQGTSINRELTKIREREIKPGALHATLQNLVKKGLLVSEKHDPAPPKGGRGMLTYVITEKAISEFDKWKTRVERLMTLVDSAKEISGDDQGGFVSKHTRRGKDQKSR